MDVKSLAAAFGLVVFGEDEVPRGDPQKLWSKVRCARQALSLDAHLRRTM
jgi:hypothetical protein